MVVSRSNQTGLSQVYACEIPDEIRNQQLKLPISLAKITIEVVQPLAY